MWFERDEYKVMGQYQAARHRLQHEIKKEFWKGIVSTIRRKPF
jgi:hypothetical protein